LNIQTKNINCFTGDNEESYFSNQKYSHQNLENGYNQYLKINGIKKENN